MNIRKKENGSCLQERHHLKRFIQRSLARELKSRGYHADLYVGASGYCVDLGVLDTESDHYVLGILIDGPMYQNAETARDRNILREEVLKQLGWNLVRVWSPDW